jgi:hypothetical protein
MLTTGTFAINLFTVNVHNFYGYSFLLVEFFYKNTLDRVVVQSSTENERTKTAMQHVTDRKNRYVQYVLRIM